MTENILKNLCLINGISGREEKVREYILSEISSFAECKTDALGNIIAFKKGKKATDKKIMIDAHMDEIGFIITDITSDGFLKFSTVGGINTAVMLARRVTVGNGVKGVIGAKPVHLSSADERKSYPDPSSLYIDIGADNYKSALELVSLGDFAVFDSEYSSDENVIMSKALDDRVGCAILIDMIKNESEYDFYATFTTAEECGHGGAVCVSNVIAPDFSIVLEATTASDIMGTEKSKQVCNLSNGPVVSFMDNSALYDKELYSAALNSGIKCQSKRAVAGGNNSGSIQRTNSGVRMVAVSLPCRYIHSPISVVNKEDIENAERLTKYLLKYIAEQ